jgi:hypothetical protein
MEFASYLDSPVIPLSDRKPEKKKKSCRIRPGENHALEHLRQLKKVMQNDWMTLDKIAAKVDIPLERMFYTLCYFYEINILEYNKENKKWKFK